MFAVSKLHLSILKFVNSHDTRPLQIDGDAGILNDLFRRVAGLAVRSVEKLPVWQVSRLSIYHQPSSAHRHARQWLTVFPQVVSRICHINSEVYKQLELVMVKVLEHYPQHAVWQMGAVVHSTVSKRSRRCVSIFNKAKVGPCVNFLARILHSNLLVGPSQFREQQDHLRWREHGEAAVGSRQLQSSRPFRASYEGAFSWTQ